MNPPAASGGGPFGALFGRSSKKASDDGGGSRGETGVSEETKKKAQAAKAYIERMYQNQYQNIAERSNRWSMMRWDQNWMTVLEICQPCTFHPDPMHV